MKKPKNLHPAAGELHPGVSGFERTLRPIQIPVLARRHWRPPKRRLPTPLDVASFDLIPRAKDPHYPRARTRKLVWKPSPKTRGPQQSARRTEQLAVPQSKGRAFRELLFSLPQPRVRVESSRVIHHFGAPIAGPSSSFAPSHTRCGGQIAPGLALLLNPHPDLRPHPQG